MTDPYSTKVINKMSIMFNVCHLKVGFTDVGFTSCGTRWSTCSHSWTCGVGAGNVGPISTSHSLFFSSHSVSFCLSSFFLSCPSTFLISPTFISPHDTPSSSHFVSSYFSCGLHNIPQSFHFCVSLHTFCLLMDFDKGIIDQLLTAPAAHPNTYSHPTLIHTLPPLIPS